MKTFFLHILVIFSGIGLALGLLSLLSGQAPGRTQAASTIRYVAKSGADAGACDTPETPCASVQYAIDQVNPGDEVLIAGGTYTDTSQRPAPPGFNYENPIISNAYITKSLTLRGGYTTTNWTVSHPATNTTILDAQGRDRVIFIYGAITVTIEGVDIRGVENWNFTPGGGIFGYSATVTISNSVIQGNKNHERGAGVFLQNSNARLIANKIICNNSGGCKTGGGGGGGISIWNSNATLIGNYISGNNAEYGGGILLEDSNAALIENIVTGNGAGCPGFGGGMVIDKSRVTLIDNIVSGNTTYLYGEDRSSGGGLIISNSDATLANNVFSGNWASDYDGIIISGGTWRASHTTFSNHGLSIYLGENANAVFTNTILVNQGTGILVAAGSKAWLNGVLWYNNSLNYGGPGAITVTGEVIGPPAFAADGYHLTSASAAIDRGFLTDVATDIDGKPRFVGLAPDLGVHEYPEVVRPLRFYLTGIYLRGGQPAAKGVLP